MQSKLPHDIELCASDTQLTSLLLMRYGHYQPNLAQLVYKMGSVMHGYLSFHSGY